MSHTTILPKEYRGWTTTSNSTSGWAGKRLQISVTLYRYTATHPDGTRLTVTAATREDAQAVLRRKIDLFEEAR